MASSHWLQIERTVRFGDTDAAGVMHFHQLLRWCHEAYEESLALYGISAEEIFPRPGQPLAVALPIMHCSADYRHPLVCGDQLRVWLQPERLDPGSFEVRYSFRRDGHDVATGLTRHVAITVETRRRCPLPLAIQRWLEASNLSAAG